MTKLILEYEATITGVYIEMVERRLGLWEFTAYPLLETGRHEADALAVRTVHTTALLWPAIPDGEWYDIWHLPDTYNAQCTEHGLGGGWCPLDREWSRAEGRLPTDWNIALDRLLVDARAYYNI